MKAFREIAARHRPCFWLDGAGGRHWSGRRADLGRLTDEDGSIIDDARSRVVRWYVGSVVEEVGSDVFAVLARLLEVLNALDGAGRTNPMEVEDDRGTAGLGQDRGELEDFGLWPAELRFDQRTIVG